MQTVNFYLAEYRPKPLSFNSQFALLAVFIALIGMLAIGYGFSQEVVLLEKDLATKNQQLTELQDNIRSMQKKLSQKKDVTDWQKKLEKQQQELQNYQKLVSLVNFPDAASKITYSQILSALAIQQSQPVWLTKIAIQAGNLSLYGATTKANSIPLYIDELKKSDSLKRHFDELTLDRNSENDQLINFQLLNGKLANE